jgi:hypothetical protein
MNSKGIDSKFFVFDHFVPDLGMRLNDQVISDTNFVPPTLECSLVMSFVGALCFLVLLLHDLLMPVGALVFLQEKCLHISSVQLIGCSILYKPDCYLFFSLDHFHVINTCTVPMTKTKRHIYCHV